jgi:transposase
MEWTVAIGVDTHKEVHVAVALDRLGVQLDGREIAATLAGYRSLLSWANELGVPVFAIEGTGSYGAGLARFLTSAGVDVFEGERPRRAERRRGKSDLIDATLAARRLLSGKRLSLPRGGGRREELRLLLLERRGAMQARNAALNQLSAVLVTAPDQVRARLGALSGDPLARAATRLRPSADVANGVVRRRVERLSTEVAEAERALAELVAGLAPRLLERMRRGTGLRWAAARLERRSWPNAKRGFLRRTRRHEPGRGLKRQQAPPPPQPRRRPPAQLGTPPHRAPTDPSPRADEQLLPTAPRRRQDDSGGTPVRQARPCPPLLPSPLRRADAPLTT